MLACRDVVVELMLAVTCPVTWPRACPVALSPTSDSHFMSDFGRQKYGGFWMIFLERKLSMGQTWFQNVGFIKTYQNKFLADLQTLHFHRQ